MREYKHINDCWNAAREAKTIEELEEIIDEFPRWSGSWYIDTDKGTVTLRNTYWDNNAQEEYEDEEDLDIPVDDEEDET